MQNFFVGYWKNGKKVAYSRWKNGKINVFLCWKNGKQSICVIKSGKDYETHRALSNIMGCGEYDIPEAVVFGNENLRVSGKVVYAPVYMVMFLEKDNTAPSYYKVNLSGLQNPSV